MSVDRNSEQRCPWCKLLIGRTDKLYDDGRKLWHQECRDYVEDLNDRNDEVMDGSGTHFDRDFDRVFPADRDEYSDYVSHVLTAGSYGSLERRESSMESQPLKTNEELLAITRGQEPVANGGETFDPFGKSCEDRLQAIAGQEEGNWVGATAKEALEHLLRLEEQRDHFMREADEMNAAKLREQGFEEGPLGD